MTTGRRLLCLVLMGAPLLLTGCALNNLMGHFVNQHPIAVIDASPEEGHVPLTVAFNAGYSHDDDGTIIDYRWDFGDPNDATPCAETVAEHTYVHPGSYLVKLTVTDDKGAFDAQLIAVVATNPPPVAVFSTSNEYPRAGDIVRFDASASYDTNGEILAYNWDFGDGNTGDGMETAHSYTEDGSYTVTLILIDDEGAEQTATVLITVQEGSGSCTDGSCGGGSDRPLAVITGLPSCAGIAVGQTITLDGSASRAAEGELVNYYWQFGDGVSASGPIASHAYDRTGMFVVEFTVTDDNGRKSTATGGISVHEPYQ